MSKIFSTTLYCVSDLLHLHISSDLRICISWCVWGSKEGKLFLLNLPSKLNIGMVYITCIQNWSASIFFYKYKTKGNGT